MIDIRDATNAAVDCIQEIQDLLKTPLENLCLEEAEIDQDKSFWMITLGYDEPKIEPASLNEGINLTFPRRPARKYRIFKVNAESGGVVSMQIRELSESLAPNALP